VRPPLQPGEVDRAPFGVTRATHDATLADATGVFKPYLRRPSDEMMRSAARCQTRTTWSGPVSLTDLPSHARLSTVWAWENCHTSRAELHRRWPRVPRHALMPSDLASVLSVS
jgi:hypothetical protein